ncbi:type II toxin-antitoxin system HicB family antitoxin [Candidatus Gribaldobacteria bacterium]|nr:type II toxin-antitoxin system HicB family antitoxin [Candidatus Gribaldobacteria bacterium]
MSKQNKVKLKNSQQFPVMVEKDEDGFYVVECPIFQGCYTQAKSLDQALKNIKEVINLCLEESNDQVVFSSLQSREFSIHSITL